jgi:hypothetical protein
MDIDQVNEVLTKRRAALVFIVAFAPFVIAQAAPAAFLVPSDAAERTSRPISALKENQAIPNLPYARGKSFSTLDAYLKHLEKNSAIDLPWWKEIAPGVFEHVRSMRGSNREVATREQLMERFGFTR